MPPGPSGSPLAPGPEHITQGDQLVGHQAVDPEIQQPVHVSGLVDGPDVHLLASGVGGGHQPRRDHPQPADPVRHLGVDPPERVGRADPAQL